jgi:hypothetical protein
MSMDPVNVHANVQSRHVGLYAEDDIINDTRSHCRDPLGGYFEVCMVTVNREGVPTCCTRDGPQ